MAVALAAKLGASVNIGRETNAYLSEAISQGRFDEDFTLLYPYLEKLDRNKKQTKKRAR